MNRLSEQPTKMLWQITDKLEGYPSAIARASRYYRSKYEADPATCIIPQSEYKLLQAQQDREEIIIDGVRVVGDHAGSRVLPRHLYLDV